MDPTPEQAEAIASYGDGLDLVLQAGAGCGKSSTLKMIALSDTRRSMVYVAYNKSIATDAQKSFPSNAACATAHSLAFRAIGVNYAHRLNGPRQTAHDAAQVLNVPRLIGDPVGVPQIVGDMGEKVAMTSRRIMRYALETVTRFCYSADPEITARHLPRTPGMRSRETLEQLGALVLPVARAAWEDIVRPDGALKFQHDHYLKLWALGRPKLDADVVLLDEGQDTNDVVSAVIRAQEHAQRIVVGDSAQQIYEWRGANDALAKFAADGALELTLSQSFRFGPAVAEAANAWLYVIDAPLRLRGFEPVPSRLAPLDDPDAVLCRTNAGAMAVVMDALASGHRVALVGGGGDMQRLARAAAALMSGRETDHPELTAFASWQQVREYAEQEADGADLRVLVKLIDEHGPEAIIAATERLVPENQAQLVVSTAHRSKGREWPKVRIHSDFRPPSPDPVTKNVTIRREEARLAYVAVTRAREVLDNTALAWVSQITAVSD
ncbi:UvrD-helicase domain-containing protein [Streptomyces malaysiensis subsp. malaysiensis]|uniref:UvrD-helicase domain-containing protein n=1 Tax=Streptomyces malaysiensis TaxID=92644 RepID=UPI0024C0AE21|nr:UvrD-helicase domain-containing protein [Streptomyces sp. NA07423]WHX19802.1 UvrD-helicase domain-containing protein [Streptomyces sp. NA07423]